MNANIKKERTKYQRKKSATEIEHVCTVLMEID
jgi:hypothetical protein